MDKLIYKPKIVGILVIVFNLIPIFWTYFIFITIPLIIGGLIFQFVKSNENLYYEIPSAILLIGSFMGLILTVGSIFEIFQY
ncbi:hypothetical protein SAMN06265367_103290 [Algoriphagus winogradskyi]|uniref:Uncharacterized protein n=1 Tax=Algoriphagus winogradskyi TaxID=237017 RepID=A0ABY1NY77_9BACT|nr:hypothetical protein SAMN06265367_103290 [Algoriphagus winogradskyi]